MEHSAYFSKNISPSIYAGDIKKLLKINQRTYTYKKQQEQKEESKKQKIKSADSELEVLKQEVKEIKESVNTLRKMLCQTHKRELEIYGRFITTVNSYESVHDHLFQKVEAQISAHEAILEQLSHSNSEAPEQKDKWAEQKEFNETILKQLDSLSGKISESAVTDGNMDQNQQIAERLNDNQEQLVSLIEQCQESGTADSELVLKKEKGFLELFQGLPVHYPVNCVLIDGAQIPVNTFVSYDPEQQLVYFEDRGNVISFNCLKIDGIIMKAAGCESAD
ncbi:hypothetical protein [Mesobacillus harenae]|uniref:hypothetical protein n=1 Tax=Mesobacillus harenae TaxID=2213203 RepID=UPI0015809936|nr:hypothetical protein [Mesobacillus harenae]